jgi:hypothetical protein
MAYIDVQPTSVLIGLAIVGLFSGFGTAFGQYLFNDVIKPWVQKHKEKIKEIKVYT